jgi:hypothetical protein
MTAGVVDTRTAPRQRLRDRLSRRHPGWWLTAAAAGAWVGLMVGSIIGMSSMRHGGPTHVGHAGHDMAAPATSHAAGAWLWVGLWLLMVVAMMWPLYAAASAGLARTIFRRWKVAVVATHVGTITGLWLGFGLVGRGAYLFVEAFVPAWFWSVAWLIVAAAVTLSMWRARLLRTCRRVGVIAPTGTRAFVTATVDGARMFPRCVALCGPVMLAMVSSHQLVLMLGGSAAVWWEQRHPRAWRDPIPGALLVVTAGAVFVMTLWKDNPWAMH